ATTVGAMLAAFGMEMAAGHEFWQTFRGYWIAFSLGLLATTPVLLLAIAGRRKRNPPSYYAEFLLFVVVNIALATWVFSLQDLQDVSIPRRTYTLIAVHAWAAFRLHAREAA